MDDPPQLKHLELHNFTVKFSRSFTKKNLLRLEPAYLSFEF